MVTQELEDLSWLLEFDVGDVEVPASAEGTHRRFLPVAFPADFGTIRTIRERAGYDGEMDVNGHPRKRPSRNHSFYHPVPFGPPGSDEPDYPDTSDVSELSGLPDVLTSEFCPRYTCHLLLLVFFPFERRL